MIRVRLTPTPPGPPETRLAVRLIVLVDGDVVAQESVVFCPFRSGTNEVADCVGCADFARIEAAESLVCARDAPLSDDEALELVVERRICHGRESLASRTPIGAIAEKVVVCATSSTTIAVADAVASESGAPGVVVVDDARRPVAFVPRSRLVRTPAAHVLVLADCQDEAFTIFDERDSLEHAVDRLIHDRQRAVVTIDADGRVTGLVSDLDVLRWVARAARGHMSHE
jgi:CBS domain-containing protein